MRPNGAVRRWEADRGFGFIRGPGDGAVRPLRANGWLFITLLCWAGITGVGVWLQRLPLPALGALAAVNAATFIAYAFDKSAARSGSRRTSEQTLHVFSLAGGWPAAWLARETLRHKSSKTSFRRVYAATVTLHCAGLVAWVFLLAPRWIG